jgi:hypothetical protein
MKTNIICRIYNALYIIMILFGILIISGCYGGGTEVGNPASYEAPSISNLSLSQTSSPSAVTGGKIIDLSGSVDFTDEDGNVSNLIIDITDSNNNRVYWINYPIEGFYGQTSGTVEFSISFSVDAEADYYILEIYIVDETGNESDPLQVEFIA